jgi:membrane-associated protease RseP (regulator of RpoE activity)
MGHYIACLRYGVDATRPYFLPAPLPLTGTLGAFIRIRSRIPSKIALFDIGIAGPIAGFLVAVPALFLGLNLSRLERLPENMGGMMSLGEPLLFQAAKWLVFGSVPEGYDVNMHPMAFAAWFGLLATALNLFPIAQLDGGHISYAVLGRYSLWVTLAMVLTAVSLTYVSSSWIAWTVMLLLMLALVGPRHPPTLDDETPLGATRLWLALAALVMLIVCFTPAPIEPFVTGP